MEKEDLEEFSKMIGNREGKLLPLNNLIMTVFKGYCTAGNQRFLVYEYMPMSSLEDHLLNSSFHLRFLLLILALCQSKL
ncbi:hypothetical protein DITRI_Ditri02bG0106400 [Diplodiscus trichospermus]